ncbi:MAG: hypothetical protein CBR30_03125 [Dictyoglomus sp. NZ13-RE01]|nr:MAG: hypothetical protein CBR30_03125 [Dictyoglomus sp. NZ13-RE01]
MEEILLGLIRHEKVISLEEIVRRTNFEKEIVLRALASLASQGKIVFDFYNLRSTGCLSCPLFRSCKRREE